ncbi:GDP-L-fucose synthase family protein [Thermanaerovibrio acidaminovorans]|jgi:GDP-L-fucose synthase|uniref:GDP-L-fucose synthase n=1 Tax=Thermanaerovibrio acidaminovorans (strain ATCC 49978 / DSM 6589 / Su883) TaxID=525903 RepID=D1B7K6_THEAS|nr:GDP-L-fucose synthase [Thermanaerovibrio acidaminovorans]ACZ18259.1 NAD-dependent epimerase/dehydratase [Thermanaerovibrio acidaminovorans DSM 6589]
MAFDVPGPIFVAGHRGLVGSAVIRRLSSLGREDVITADRSELDLTDQAAVRSFMRRVRPGCVFLCAAKVGGIMANAKYPADFIGENLAIEVNVIREAFGAGVGLLLFLGSSCIYPKLCPQPIREDYLLSGPLEATNEAYAVAKIAGLKMCEAYSRQYGVSYISVMPSNLYGPGDNFHLETSHVLPAMIRKFHEAKARGAEQVVLWGTGSPRREFLHVDDLACASVFLLENYRGYEPINVGTGTDVTIAELADMVRNVVGFRGRVVWDSSKPDGTPRKLLDVSKIRSMGWSPSIGLEEGIRSTYRWFLDNWRDARGYAG